MKIGKKTAVAKELTRQERNRRNNIKRLTIAFLVAFVLFILLLIIQSSILNQEDKQQVYQVIKDIETGTKIDESNIDSYLQLKEVQLSLIPENYITDAEDINGKFTNRAYKARDIITKDGITDVEKMYKDSIVNPVEVSFNVGDISVAVSGTIKEGDYVNIYGLRKDAFNDSQLAEMAEELYLEDEYFTFKHVYISKVYDGSGVRINTDQDSTAGVLFTIILSEDDVTTFNEMLSNCTIRMAKLVYDSDKTYLDYLNDVNLEAGTLTTSESAQSKKKAGDDGKYFWDIDTNLTGLGVEAGTTDPEDYSYDAETDGEAEENTLTPEQAAAVQAEAQALLEQQQAEQQAEQEAEETEQAEVTE